MARVRPDRCHVRPGIETCRPPGGWNSSLSEKDGSTHLAGALGPESVIGAVGTLLLSLIQVLLNLTIHSSEVS